MANTTKFSELRCFIRAAVLDMDSRRYIYSDSVLDSQIRWELTLRNASPYSTDDKCYGLSEDSESGHFTVILTPAQKSILALRCAIRLMSGKSDNFSYKTPVMSVSRTGQVRELLDDLHRALMEVEGGMFAIATDTDYGALVQAYNRFFNDLDASLFAWPGSASGQL